MSLEHHYFFFQAEDGIRDFHVTGVQTCVLPICGRVLEQMSFGQSTPADVERVFGAADERPPDGSLVYRTEDRRRRETESVTFRFEGGVLSRICRTRSQ